MNLIFYESPSVQQAKLTIIALEKILETLTTTIEGRQQVIAAFDREYHHRLGDLTKALSQLRTELGMSPHLSATSPPARSRHLNDEDEMRLKRAFRQAAKRCHPDYLTPETSERGKQLFDRLHKAYRLRDLTTVENILWLLKSGQAFHSSPIIITDRELILWQKKLLVETITQKQEQLKTLQSGENQRLSDTRQWNAALYDYQTQLEDELAQLRQLQSQRNPENNGSAQCE